MNSQIKGHESGLQNYTFDPKLVVSFEQSCHLKNIHSFIFTIYRVWVFFWKLCLIKHIYQTRSMLDVEIL